MVVLGRSLYISTHWNNHLFFVVLENLLDVSIHWNAYVVLSELMKHA